MAFNLACAFGPVAASAQTNCQRAFARAPSSPCSLLCALGPCGPVPWPVLGPGRARRRAAAAVFVFASAAACHRASSNRPPMKGLLHGPRLSPCAGPPPGRGCNSWRGIFSAARWRGTACNISGGEPPPWPPLPSAVGDASSVRGSGGRGGSAEGAHILATLTTCKRLLTCVPSFAPLAFWL